MVSVSETLSRLPLPGFHPPSAQEVQKRRFEKDAHEIERDCEGKASSIIKISHNPKDQAQVNFQKTPLFLLFRCALAEAAFQRLYCQLSQKDNLRKAIPNDVYTLCAQYFEQRRQQTIQIATEETILTSYDDSQKMRLDEVYQKLVLRSAIWIFEKFYDGSQLGMAKEQEIRDRFNKAIRIITDPSQMSNTLVPLTILLLNDSHHKDR